MLTCIVLSPVICTWIVSPMCHLFVMHNSVLSPGIVIWCLPCFQVVSPVIAYLCCHLSFVPVFLVTHDAYLYFVSFYSFYLRLTCVALSPIICTWCFSELSPIFIICVCMCMRDHIFSTDITFDERKKFLVTIMFINII